MIAFFARGVKEVGSDPFPVIIVSVAHRPDAIECAEQIIRFNV